MTLNNAINKLKDAYSTVQSNEIDLTQPAKASLASFKDQKEVYVRNTISSSIKQLREIIWKMPSDESSALVNLHRQLEDNKTNPKLALDVIDKMAEFAAVAKTPEASGELKLRAPKLPTDIRDDMSADIVEMQKCFNAGCYRSTTILCGRILETALHRKYFDVTGKDILETNPGIGLGTLIAKLNDKKVEFDPGLTQQIHLINQVRIFSVHKKQNTFTPSAAQANAMVLYTMDVLDKMFQ